MNTYAIVMILFALIFSAFIVIVKSRPSVFISDLISSYFKEISFQDNSTKEMAKDKLAIWESKKTLNELDNLDALEDIMDLFEPGTYGRALVIAKLAKEIQENFPSEDSNNMKWALLLRECRVTILKIHGKRHNIIGYKQIYEDINKETISPKMIDVLCGLNKLSEEEQK